MALDPAQPPTKSSVSLKSPKSSREPSPVRQLLSPDNPSHSKDAPLGSNQQYSSGLTRSASVPTEEFAPTGTVIHRSHSNARPITSKPLPLNDAVNTLWGLQRQDEATPSQPHTSNSQLGISQTPLELEQQNSSTANQFDTATGENTQAKASPPVGPQDGDTTATAKSTTSAKVHRGFSVHSSTLETVDEGDHPHSPPHQSSSSASSFMQSNRSSDATPQQSMYEVRQDEASSIDGGESAPLSRVNTVTPQRPQDEQEKKSSNRRESSSRSTFSVSRRPLASLVPGKVRSTNDTSMQNMTVETETVPSIPQTFLSGANDRLASGRREDSGTLRARTSNETIKPRKEKKRTARKAPSIVSGTYASRADLFEAKVASAVDEDTSDSDETFVYESNPPEPRARHHRNHSRTPSVTSMQSLGADRRSARMAAYMDGSRRLRGKRSMKFASNQYNNGSMDDDSADGGATVRASQNRTRFHGMSNRYLGPTDRIYGRDPTSSEQNSPFAQASRARFGSRHDFREYSKPQSLSHPVSRPSTSRKSEGSPFGAARSSIENERTPLVSSVRSQRTRTSRHSLQPDVEQVEFYVDDERHWAGRFAWFVLMCMAILLAVMGAAAFFFATTKPLLNVNVQQIENVLASEQEIMLDLVVQAVNPNIFTIAVASMDVNIFAKSTHVGGDNVSTLAQLDDHRVEKANSLDRSQPYLLSRLYSPGKKRRPGPADSVDRGTDPIPDPSVDPHTMLLGRVLEFDSDLLFGPSPWRQLAQNSSGELRLQRPGNKTEVGGSEKWERVVQHSFELIIRGVLKYQLPLSSRVFTASVGSSVIVHPELGVDERGATMLVKSWD